MLKEAGENQVLGSEAEKDKNYKKEDLKKLRQYAKNIKIAHPQIFPKKSIIG